LIEAGFVWAMAALALAGAPAPQRSGVKVDAAPVSPRFDSELPASGTDNLDGQWRGLAPPYYVRWRLCEGDPRMIERLERVLTRDAQVQDFAGLVEASCPKLCEATAARLKKTRGALRDFYDDLSAECRQCATEHCRESSTAFETFESGAPSSLQQLAARDWSAARRAAGTLDAGDRPAAEEEEFRTLRHFSSRAAFRAWLSGHGVSPQAGDDPTALSLRQILRARGRLHCIRADIYGMPPDHAGLLHELSVRLAPEVRSALFLQDDVIVPCEERRPSVSVHAWFLGSHFSTVATFESNDACTVPGKPVADVPDSNGADVRTAFQLINALLERTGARTRLAAVDGGGTDELCFPAFVATDGQLIDAAFAEGLLLPYRGPE
jgi:hypothetical protein